MTSPLLQYNQNPRYLSSNISQETHAITPEKRTRIVQDLVRLVRERLPTVISSPQSIDDGILGSYNKPTVNLRFGLVEPVEAKQLEHLRNALEHARGNVMLEPMARGVDLVIAVDVAAVLGDEQRRYDEDVAHQRALEIHNRVLGQRTWLASSFLMVVLAIMLFFVWYRYPNKVQLLEAYLPTSVHNYLERAWLSRHTTTAAFGGSAADEP